MVSFYMSRQNKKKVKQRARLAVGNMFPTGERCFWVRNFTIFRGKQMLKISLLLTLTFSGRRTSEVHNITSFTIVEAKVFGDSNHK